jgi:hypothetical protein
MKKKYLKTPLGLRVKMLWLEERGSEVDLRKGDY